MAIQLPRWRAALTLQGARDWSDQFAGWLERILAAGQQSGVNAAPAGPAGGGLAGQYPNPAVPVIKAAAAVTSATGTTLSAAALTGGVILRSGPSAGFSDTTDTAANLLTAISAGARLVGQSFDCLVINTSAQTMTVQPGSGVTLTGNTTGGNFTVGAASTRLFRAIFTAIGTPAMTLYA
jgi:hypothetical protein